MADNIIFDFNNSYAKLPARFFQRVSPSAAVTPKLIQFNQELAENLCASSNSSSDQDLADIFSGKRIPMGADPLAMAYAGHQFGYFSPLLGDGRAILLGEVVASNNKRYDVQLKGAGQTPFSRNGDGKAALGPVIREYIVSEAMFHLGVPTTRSLAVVDTGDQVFRETPLPGAVLTRIASSHIRIGHFEYFAARDDYEGVNSLVRYSMGRHYPDVTFEEDDIYLLFFKQVITSYARLVAHWMDVGFIHGVMNTDNASISGETIDYGPCAFMDHFQFERVFSSIDRHGRYSYINQPAIAQWNLARLADCLIPLAGTDKKVAIDKFQEALSDFENTYLEQWEFRYRRKLGLSIKEPGDALLIKNWLQYLETESLDYTLSFRSLSDILRTAELPRGLNNTPEFIDFKGLWLQRLKAEQGDFSSIALKMDLVNPLYIPRNHQIEQTISEAVTGNFSKFKEMIELLKNPFKEQPHFSTYKAAPLPDEVVTETFCGT